MKAIGVVLILVGLAVPGIPYVIEALAADRCLDRGGSYDYEHAQCDLLQNHPFIPFTKRHPLLPFAGLSAALLGSGALALRLRKRPARFQGAPHDRVTYVLLALDPWNEVIGLQTSCVTFLH